MEIRKIRRNDMQTNPMCSEFGGMVEYSTSEHVVGKWIDGSTIYEKTISIGALPNNSVKSTPHGISNLGYLISANGVAQRNSPYRAHPIPYVNATSITDQIQVVVLEQYVTIYTSMDYSGFSNTYVTLRYTKSS